MTPAAWHALVVAVLVSAVALTYLIVEGSRDIDDCWTGFRFDNDDSDDGLMAVADAVQDPITSLRHCNPEWTPLDDAQLHTYRDSA